MTPLRYPEEWLRGWQGVLKRWPNAGPMPRVDIVPRRVHVEASSKHPQGKYDPRRHVVTLYPEDDVWDALCTLVHELAHAWSPPERGHHGPKWRATYIALFEFLVGMTLNVDEMRAAFDRLPEDMRKVMQRSRRGDSLQGALCDLTFTYQLAELAPVIWREPTGDLIARIGQTHHRVGTAAP